MLFSVTAVTVRNRHAPVFSQRAVRDLDPGRRLPALVFRAVEHLPDPAHRRLVVAARHDPVEGKLFLDVGGQDVVEDLVGRQRVLIGLVRPELGAVVPVSAPVPNINTLSGPRGSIPGLIIR